MNWLRGERAQAISARWNASFLGELWRRSDTLNLGTAALALGAQEVLCTAPLLVSLSTLMVHFHLGFVGGFLTDVLGLSPDARDYVNALFLPKKNPSLLTLWFGLLTTAVFYVAVAGTTQRCVDAVWGSDEGAMSALWRRVVWVCVQLPGFALALFAGRALHANRTVSEYAGAGYALSLTIAITLFHWWGHHLFLKGEVSWRHLLPGSIVIGVGTGLLTALSPLFMPQQVVENTESYGLIGAAFVLSIWAVSYSAIVVYGTLIGRVFVDRRERRRNPHQSLTPDKPTANKLNPRRYLL